MITQILYAEDEMGWSKSKLHPNLLSTVISSKEITLRNSYKYD